MVVVIAVTSANIDPVDHDAKDSGIGLLERLFGPPESLPGCLSAQHREDDAVHTVGQDDGVGKSEHRGRIDKDMIKPRFQGVEHLSKKV